ncbi:MULTISPECIES: TrbI/VirB10 family protein [unclassified Coleofasciculus]|uniref:TrbI/VirB10 family protein n=1 Tax=unclassified Coleofasciculus TaxID=2692782 RepID=UPI0018820C59|nr:MULTISPECIES: TrbI/VirB10 family protein [unclassified Coleofasciculus]MBE9124729.1 hypothetical protein [Coleofasciculus sp. LEGE 07081]MBE9148181.1 hypothetical protein [Coleofasciculus sp. LEGE 07092]
MASGEKLADIDELFEEGNREEGIGNSEGVEEGNREQGIDNSEGELDEVSKAQHYEDSDTPPLDPELSKQLAGYDEEEDQLLQEEDMLLQDEEQPSERPFSEQGIVRMGFILLATGAIVLIGILLWNVFISRKPSPEQASSPKTEEETTFEQDETGELKAQMAFNEQRKSIRDNQAQETQTRETPEPSQPSEAEKSESPSDQQQEQIAPSQPPPTVSPSSTRPRRTFSDIPDPKPPQTPPSSPPSLSSPPVPDQSETRPSSIRVFSSPPSPPAPEAQAQPEQEEIDPFARWEKLATLGQSRVSSSSEAGAVDAGTDGAISAVGSTSSAPVSVEYPNSERQVTGNNPTPSDSTRSIPTVVIGSRSALPNPSVPNQPFSSPGEKGIILNRRTVQRTAIASREVSPEMVTSPTNSYKQVAIGTSASGKVAVPMYWDSGGTPLPQKYVITLTEPLRSVNGRVALPKGTALITEIVSVSSNRLVNQQVVAIVYELDGQIVQQQIDPLALSIRGADNRPLIASGYFDPGPDIAKQDILISVLSSVGKIGEIVNLPETVSSASSGTSSGGDGTTSTTTTTTTTTRDSPDLLAAALQGFFQPLAERLQERSSSQTQERLSRPNIAIVPKGTPVSVVVESFMFVQ